MPGRLFLEDYLLLDGGGLDSEGVGEDEGQEEGWQEARPVSGRWLYPHVIHGSSY